MAGTLTFRPPHRIGLAFVYIYVHMYASGTETSYPTVIGSVFTVVRDSDYYWDSVHHSRHLFSYLKNYPKNGIALDLIYDGNNIQNK